jgi:hypothetical protein
MMTLRLWKKLIRREKCLYEQQREKPTFQKAWEDKKKFKMDQRKKGTNHPFSETVLKDNHHLESPRMAEVGGTKAKTDTHSVLGL